MPRLLFWRFGLHYFSVVPAAFDRLPEDYIRLYVLKQ